MRQYASIIAMAVLVALATGCASFKGSAGKTLASTALAADASMKAWAVWVQKGLATDPQQSQVKAAYQKYQVAMAIAVDSYDKAVSSGDESAWTTAATILQFNQSALLGLITKFTTTP